jgi:hypothetical protein
MAVKLGMKKYAGGGTIRRRTYRTLTPQFQRAFPRGSAARSRTSVPPWAVVLVSTVAIRGTRAEPKRFSEFRWSSADAIAFFWTGYR